MGAASKVQELAWELALLICAHGAMSLMIKQVWKASSKADTLNLQLVRKKLALHCTRAAPRV